MNISEHRKTSIHGGEERKIARTLKERIFTCECTAHSSFVTIATPLREEKYEKFIRKSSESFEKKMSLLSCWKNALNEKLGDNFQMNLFKNLIETLGKHHKSTHQHNEFHQPMPDDANYRSKCLHKIKITSVLLEKSQQQINQRNK